MKAKRCFRLGALKQSRDCLRLHTPLQMKHLLCWDFIYLFHDFHSYSKPLRTQIFSNNLIQFLNASVFMCIIE